MVYGESGVVGGGREWGELGVAMKIALEFPALKPRVKMNRSPPSLFFAGYFMDLQSGLIHDLEYSK